MKDDRFVGVVSDTHGLLREEVAGSLQGAHAILHGGDIGSSAVLSALARIAPVTAVRGNVDRGPWADALPAQAIAVVRGCRIALVHNIAQYLGEEQAVDWVVYGHSHQPRLAKDGKTILFNPGSCGPRRFRLPISWARLWIDEAPWRVEFLRLTAEGVVSSAGSINLEEGEQT